MADSPKTQTIEGKRPNLFGALLVVLSYVVVCVIEDLSLDWETVQLLNLP